MRKAGTRVRITAQLIRADTGAHLWTDSYDRELKDIFATQEDIAQAIVTALQVPLGLKQGETLVSNRTIDPETYQDYLRARALARARSLDYGIALLEAIVKRDPNYAPAWALLANSYSLALLGTPAVGSGSAEAQRIAAELTPKQEAAAQRAIELDPNQADVAASLGQLQVRRGNFIMAEDLYSKALALDPNNSNALLLKANLFAAVGHPKEGLAAMKAAVTLEPFVPSYNSNAARHFWLNGQDATAISILNDLPSNYPTRAASLAQIFASQGRYHDAADVLAELPPGTFLPETVEEAVRLLRTAPKAAGLPRTLPRLGNLGFVYPYVGAPDRMLEYYEDAAKGGYLAALTYAAFWHPSAVAVRKTSASRPICGTLASSITGAPAAGPISAAPWAQTISPAIEATTRSTSEPHGKVRLWRRTDGL